MNILLQIEPYDVISWYIYKAEVTIKRDEFLDHIHLLLFMVAHFDFDTLNVHIVLNSLSLVD